MMIRAMMIALWLVGLGVSGCQATPQAAEPESTAAEHEKAMISKDEAIRIARKAIEGGVELSEGGGVEVVQQGEVYIVTFTRNDPPGTRGPDYDARVTINARTGEVIELLGSS
jgi:uncharacterized membrane protein YkoI